jgi:hypothetical protein
VERRVGLLQKRHEHVAQDVLHAPPHASGHIFLKTSIMPDAARRVRPLSPYHRAALQVRSRHASRSACSRAAWRRWQRSCRSPPFASLSPCSAIRMDDRRLDEETWQAVDLFSRNSMKTFQELADEALARSRAGASPMRRPSARLHWSRNQFPKLVGVKGCQHPSRRRRRSPALVRRSPMTLQYVRLQHASHRYPINRPPAAFSLKGAFQMPTEGNDIPVREQFRRSPRPLRRKATLPQSASARTSNRLASDLYADRRDNL